MWIIIVNKPEIQNQVVKNRLSELKPSNLVNEKPHCHLNPQIQDQPELPEDHYYNNLKFSVCQTYLFSYFLAFIFLLQIRILISKMSPKIFAAENGGVSRPPMIK